MEVTFTSHAEDMLKEREFSKEFIQAAVLKSHWREEGKGNIWYALQKVGNKTLRVVVKGKEPPFTVITMYFDRRIK
jgi:spore maturation protein CgeB